MGKSPDLSKLAKTLTTQRLACTDEIKVLMDCMMVRMAAAAAAAAAVALSMQHEWQQQQQRGSLTCTFSTVLVRNVWVQLLSNSATRGAVAYLAVEQPLWRVSAASPC
jgi:hypothetical protein